MAKDPAVLFYTSDFLTGTSRLSDEQCGQYIRALCSQHQEGEFSKEELFAILKSYDSPVWKKFKKNENGLYYNERMKFEIERRISFCESRSHRGIAGRKKESYDNHTISVRKSIGNHTENENDNIIKDEIKKKEMQEEKEKTWRTDYQTYYNQCNAAFDKLIADWNWIAERKQYHPRLKIRKSAEKMFFDYWGTEAGWKKRKTSRTKEIDWLATINNGLSLKCNQVWLSSNENDEELEFIQMMEKRKLNA